LNSDQTLVAEKVIAGSNPLASILSAETALTAAKRFLLFDFANWFGKKKPLNV
jgi:hypothetical protein